MQNKNNNDKNTIQSILDAIMGILVFIYFVSILIFIQHNEQITMAEVARIVNLYGFLIYMKLLRI